MDCHGNCEWIEVESLGDVTLFLGNNHSISVLASTSIGCKSNSIYFYNDFFNYYDYFGGPFHFFIFNLEYKRIAKFPILDNMQSWLMSLLIWIVPTFIWSHSIIFQSGNFLIHIQFSLVGSFLTHYVYNDTIQSWLMLDVFSLYNLHFFF